MNRQRQLLAVLVAVLAASLLYAFLSMPRQEKAPPRTASPQPSAVKTVKSAKTVPPGKSAKPVKVSGDRLLLELLDREPMKFPGAGRDIFRMAGGPVVAEVEPEEIVPPPPPPPKPPPTPEELLRGAVTEVTFLGFLEKRGVRTVFLSSGEDVYLVKSGERFGKNKELIAREITAKQLVVGWVDGPETVTVQLLENEKLQPATIGGASPGTGSAASSFGAPNPFGITSPRPAGAVPRRLLVPQRSSVEKPPQAVEEPPPMEALPEEPPAEADDQPMENISQEELLQQGLPSGE